MWRVWVGLWLCLVSGAAAKFHQGDFIQTARRGQFHQQRTTWHDLQGRHCPRFNVDATVAIPIHKPTHYDALDEYKIQFAFDHERLVSSWLTVLAKPDAPGAGLDLFHTHKLTNDVLVPYVFVRFWKRGDALMKVQIEGRRLPEAFVKDHPKIVEEYKNRDHWPKHVIVVYQWYALDEVDAERGLMVLLYGGAGVIIAMIVGVLITAKDKIAEFFRELASEGLQTTGAALKEERKAE